MSGCIQPNADGTCSRKCEQTEDVFVSTLSCSLLDGGIRWVRYNVEICPILHASMARVVKTLGPIRYRWVHFGLGNPIPGEKPSDIDLMNAMVKALDDYHELIGVDDE